MKTPCLQRIAWIASALALTMVPASARAQDEGAGPPPVDAEGLKNGLRAFLEDPVGVLLDGSMTYGGKILLFLALLLAARIVAGLLGRLVGEGLSASRLDVSDLLQEFAVTTTRKIILFLGILFAMSAVGIPIGPFLAAFGVVGFIVGFALQDTMSNFASGVMILLYRPYDIGDVVIAGGETGKVEAMTLVSTTMVTPDNQKIIVPNGSIWGGTITNVTANDTRRVDLVAGIGYDDDIEKAERVLERIVGGHELVLADPEPVIKLNELADSSVNFVVRPWTKTSDYWTVYWDLTRAIKTEFDKEGLSIPYPQRDVHVYEEKKAS